MWGTLRPMDRGLGTAAVMVAGAVLAALAGCESAPTVALNQRLFSLPGMNHAGSTCMLVRLGDSGSSTGGGGTQGLEMTIRVGNDQLFVEVSEGRTVLVRRGYDETFFRSQRVDEYRVTATTGLGLLIRNWGSYGPDGEPACASASDDGTRNGTTPAQQP